MKYKKLMYALLLALLALSGDLLARRRGGRGFRRGGVRRRGFRPRGRRYYGRRRGFRPYVGFGVGAYPGYSPYYGYPYYYGRPGFGFAIGGRRGGFSFGF